MNGEKKMKTLMMGIVVIVSCCTTLCFASQRGTANTYNLQMLHASGGYFAWEELGSGSNKFSFYSLDQSNTFQMAFFIGGSVEFDILSATGLGVYAISGGPAPTLEGGDCIFPTGHYVLSYDSSKGAAAFIFVTPGVSLFTTGDDPLWTMLEVSSASVHWQQRNGQLEYEFTGNQSSEFWGLLNHTAGPSDEECFWYGSVSSIDITLPTEGEQGVAVFPSGNLSIEAGLYVDPEKPFRLVLTFGEEAVNPLPEDINGDGVVDVADLLLLIAAWGSTSP